MNASASYASETLVGPPSQPIHVREFIKRCSHSPSVNGRDDHRATSWIELSEEAKHALKEECSVADLESSLNETLSNPFQYSLLVQNHEDNIEAIRAASKPNGQPPKTSKSRKRKRTGLSTPDKIRSDPEALQLRNNLEHIALSCWSYPTDAAFFTRPQKNSDLNILTKAKRSQSSQAQTSLQLAAVEDAVLVVSVYNRLSWGNHLSRSSQHAILASQTLGDLYDVIPCPSNELPSEIKEEGETAGYNSDEVTPHLGAVVCIEGIAHGDGQAEEDYSDKLIQQVQLMPEKRRPQITKGAGMYDQSFTDLSLRLNQAYWFLHQGTCEHFLVIDSIRALHPNDPTDGYPLTLHIAPPIIDLCMACTRVPAVLSIVGDMRLGQSPFKICRPCWTLFGEPNAQEKVVVVPLPKYEHGW